LGKTTQNKNGFESTGTSSYTTTEVKIPNKDKLLRFSEKAKDKEINILIDSRASVNMISQELAKKLNVNTTISCSENQLQVTITEETEYKVKTQGIKLS